MGRFFNPDNNFFHMINNIINMIYAGLLWILTSGIWVPIFLYDITAYATVQSGISDNSLIVTATVFGCLFTVPMGAATCGLYNSLIKCVKYNRGYIGKEFFSSFKSNFKMATPVYGIWFVFCSFLVIDIYITRQWLESNSPFAFMYYTSIVFAALALCWFWFLFPYIARFECTRRVAIKNTLIITVANIQWALLLLLIFIAAIFICLQVQIFLFILPGFYVEMQTLIVEKVFKKYRTEEDIQKEIDENTDYSDHR